MPRSVYLEKLKTFSEFAFAADGAFRQRGKWHDFFRPRIGPGFDGQIVVELGCFDAAFLCRIAAKFPTTAFVGIDWKCRAIYDGAARIAAEQLPNVALIRGRGQDVRQIFGDGEIAEAWLFHPDPCANPHELPNRLLSERFLLDINAVFRSGGVFSLKTDHPGYFQWPLGLFGLPAFSDALPRRQGDLHAPEFVPRTSTRLHECFTTPITSFDFWNDVARFSGRRFSYEVTLFERRFLRRREPIYYFEVAKRTGERFLVQNGSCRSPL